MRLTIIKSDNVVGVDGEFFNVDCTALPSDFHALQWEGPDNGVGGGGEAEWTGRPKPANTEVVDLGDYYAYIEAWRAEKARVEAVKVARAAALAKAELDATLTDATPPQSNQGPTVL